MKKIDTIFLIFLGLGLLAIIIGGALIYEIMTPPPVSKPLTPLGTMLSCMLILSLGASAGWAFHGTGFFLFKVEGNTSRTEVINNNGQETE